MVPEVCNKIGKDPHASLASLRMILDRQAKRIIAEPHLLDDVVGRAPGFDFETVAEPIYRLVMGAVDQRETMGGRLVGPERLDISFLHLWRVMTRNVETKGAAERDVHYLHALADRKDG